MTAYSNPGGANGQPLRMVWRLLREPRARWPEQLAVPVADVPPLGAAAARITFVGHSTFFIQTAFGNILTDPVWAARASPLPFAGPKRVRAAALRLDDLPAVSLILLSHNHYDHCDLRTLRFLHERFAPRCVTLAGNGALLRRAGFTEVEELAWWQEASSADIAITAAPAQHFSGRTLFDRNRALWGSFVVRFGGRTIYFGGDSGYGAHYREIQTRFGPCDLALLPIGAYEPRWFMRDVHMNPAEAVQAHIDLASRRSLGMHFGTFQLTTEAIDAPVHALAAALEERGVPAEDFRAPEFGESFELPG